MLKNKKEIKKYLYVIIGATILSFGIYNVHQQTDITEGGILGTLLLLEYWFHIPPPISSFVMDFVCYGVAFLCFGKVFAKFAIISSLTFATTYSLWELFPPILPNLSDYPLIAAVVGALFVGIGCGLVVREGGACNGDDALAMILSKFTKKPIAFCYMFTDLTVLLLSLTYIPFARIVYSLVTVTISSFILGKIVDTKKEDDKKDDIH